jgi:hypothetical protein
MISVLTRPGLVFIYTYRDPIPTEDDDPVTSALGMLADDQLHHLVHRIPVNMQEIRSIRQVRQR